MLWSSINIYVLELFSVRFLNIFVPFFDPAGKYLYFLTDRSLFPVYSSLDETWIYPNSTRIAAVSLRKDVLSPLPPRNDSEPGKEEKPKEEKPEKKEEGKKEEKPKEPKKKKPEPLKIDLDGFESRLVILPPKAGNYSTLRAVKGQVIFLDIEVIDDPSQLAKGVDPQLERAIKEVISMLKANPPKKIGRPAYQDRTAKGIKK